MLNCFYIDEPQIYLLPSPNDLSYDYLYYDTGASTLTSSLFGDLLWVFLIVAQCLKNAVFCSF